MARGKKYHQRYADSDADKDYRRAVRRGPRVERHRAVRDAQAEAQLLRWLARRLEEMGEETQRTSERAWKDNPRKTQDYYAKELRRQRGVRADRAAAEAEARWLAKAVKEEARRVQREVAAEREAYKHARHEMLQSTAQRTSASHPGDYDRLYQELKTADRAQRACARRAKRRR